MKSICGLIISKWVPSRRSSKGFTGYELDLVLGSGKRIFLTDSGYHDELLEDVRALAAFLGIPLWDGAEG